MNGCRTLDKCQACRHLIVVQDPGTGPKRGTGAVWECTIMEDTNLYLLSEGGDGELRRSM